MINSALRMMEAETIIKMGFFIRDLHCEIEQLHKEQMSIHGKPFIVYRGQGLSTTDFNKLLNAKCGLISFNNFVSTSKIQELSLDYAKIASTEVDMIGILFKMSIDPSVSSIPFALIQEVSHFQTEEVLFSMHTVFRIRNVEKINNSNQLYQVELELTSDDDEQLLNLTTHIRKQIQGLSGWHELFHLLEVIGEFDKAEELFRLMFARKGPKSLNNCEIVSSIVKSVGEQDSEWLRRYQKFLDADEDSPEVFSYLTDNLNELFQFSQILGLPQNPSLRGLRVVKTEGTREPPVPTYNGLGTFYPHNISIRHDLMCEYAERLAREEEQLKMLERLAPSDYSRLDESYFRIAGIYTNMEKYSQALLYYEKALKIRQNILPSNHPDLAKCYHNIGVVYHCQKLYSKALSFCQKAQAIQEQILPKDHPDFFYSYFFIGEAFIEISDYSNALSYIVKALQIQKKNLPQTHPALVVTYQHIGKIYHATNEYRNAISSFKEALSIQEQTPTNNYYELCFSYFCIGQAYKAMGEYSNALSYARKVLDMVEKTFPPNDPNLTFFYHDIGCLLHQTKEYSSATYYFDKVIIIQEKSLPANHPDLVSSYNNMAQVLLELQDYSKACSFYQKALHIQEKMYPLNYPSLATYYNLVGHCLCETREYSNALQYFEKALETLGKILPQDHADLTNCYYTIGRLLDIIEEHSECK